MPSKFHGFGAQNAGAHRIAGIKYRTDHVEEKRVAPKGTRKKSLKKSQYIDGHKLSQHEVAFEEFRSKQFDSENWLKKNRLTF